MNRQLPSGLQNWVTWDTYELWQRQKWCTLPTGVARGRTIQHNCFWSWWYLSTPLSRWTISEGLSTCLCLCFLFTSEHVCGARWMIPLLVGNLLEVSSHFMLCGWWRVLGKAQKIANTMAANIPITRLWRSIFFCLGCSFCWEIPNVTKLTLYTKINPTEHQG